jgi:hypothetical protein
MEKQLGRLTQLGPGIVAQAEDPVWQFDFDQASG